jgi:Fe-S cluster biogenesis protein NfuA
MSAELDQQVRTVIETEIRPQIQLHNGDIELIKIENDVVYVSLKGACIGCPFSMYTLILGVQETIQKHCPSIKLVKMI